MSKKTAGFDLINSNFGKYPLAHHSYIYYHLVSFDLYAQSNLHHVSKHDLILRTNQFLEVRRKK